MKTLFIFAAVFMLSANRVRTQEADTGKDHSAGLASITLNQSGGTDTTRPPADFLAVDKEPTVISKKEPEYPEIAKRAGMEGRVWVKIWIDKSGLPHEVVLLKSDQEIFNAPAIAAARQFRFTPAMMQGKPVDVWVSVPFKFRLAEKKGNANDAADASRDGFPPQIMEFTRKILEGGIPDTESVHKFVTERSQVVVNGDLKPLSRAIDEQRHGKQFLEQPGRLVVFRSGGMSDDGHSGYIVARTEGKGKNTRTHYHTILIRQDSGGGWKIVHWHSWH